MPTLKQSDRLTKLAKQAKGLALRNAAKKSLNWFKQNVQNAFKQKVKVQNDTWFMNRVGMADQEFKDGISMTKFPLVGSMYFYLYDPKWKETLPYYDMFPLIIPIGYAPNGFYGVNFHYLPYIPRAQLLDGLLNLKATTKGKDYVRVSYDALKGFPNSIYKPTVKRYLYGHVRSAFAEVHFDEWENAVMLPVESFKKANKRVVWSDSRDMIR